MARWSGHIGKTLAHRPMQMAPDAFLGAEPSFSLSFFFLLIMDTRICKLRHMPSPMKQRSTKPEKTVLVSILMIQGMVLRFFFLRLRKAERGRERQRERKSGRESERAFGPCGRRRCQLCQLGFVRCPHAQHAGHRRHGTAKPLSTNHSNLGIYPQDNVSTEYMPKIVKKV